MKTIELEIPDGKRAEWVDGVLTLVDDKPIEYKFNVGDKVKAAVAPALKYTITGQFAENGEPMYKLSDGFGETSCPETWLVSQDITERIKTFEDAVEWCATNGKKEMTDVYAFIHNNLSNMEGEIDEEDKDILAYLKLRIITIALNEGWKPTYEMAEYDELVKNMFVPDFGDEEVPVIRGTSIYGDSSSKLCFKSEELAIYAAKQFYDIYADFCGCGKGGEA